MKQKIFLIIITGVIFYIIQPAYAELYKYIDENGVVSYTDDYSRVSKSEKKSIEVIEEIESTKEENAPAEGDKTLQKEDTQKENPATELAVLRKQLDQSKKELSEEYNALDVERKRLLQQRKTAKTNAEKLSYQQNIKNLNNNIKQYTERSKTYQKLVVEYNNKINKE
ncbi:MAG: DUF4124 domain-containing protein [Desulfobacteraceae bacterium]|nr:DUF4124 domain-containing protein [Desulfobacteraceae bacterium]